MGLSYVCAAASDVRLGIMYLIAILTQIVDSEFGLHVDHMLGVSLISDLCRFDIWYNFC